MELIQLQNEYLQVGIKQKGAELASIQSRESGLEYMWEADPTYWGRHSSILYPIVGRVFNDQYVHEGQTFDMRQHGLARNLPFELRQSSSTFAEFVLQSNEETLKQYPFDFVFIARYELVGKEVSIHYIIENPGETVAFFSVGAHPAFRCPIHAHEKRSDYRLVFDHPEEARTQHLEGGFRTGDSSLVLQNSQVLPITDQLFDQDALIFQSLRSHRVSLENSAGERFWTFNFEGFPYLGIWSKDDKAPFVCIEPWFGVADQVGGYSALKHKEGIIPLESGKSFHCKHAIEVL